MPAYVRVRGTRAPGARACLQARVRGIDNGVAEDGEAPPPTCFTGSPLRFTFRLRRQGEGRRGHAAAGGTRGW
jgi:hypothetical protein